MNSLFRAAILSVALTSAAIPSTAFAAVAISISDDAIDSLGNGPFTLGYSFVANQSINVNAFGIFDAGRDGLVDSYEIGLWDSVGTLLKSATLAAGTGTTLTQNFRYTSISSTILGPGVYRIGALYLTGNDPLVGLVGSAANLTTNSAISFGTRSFGRGSALTNPVEDYPPDTGYFGPNFKFDAVAPVPEPEAFMSMILGLGLAGWVARRRKRLSAI